MSQYTELDWEHTWPPLYGSTITIPENTILWRSYDTQFPAIGDRFAYYSSKQVAKEYKQNSTRELGHFISSRPLKLLDYRFMKVLLTRLIHTNTHDKTIQELASIMLSFGLCSLGHQIQLVKMRYKNVSKPDEYKQIEQSIKALEKYYKPSNIIEQLGIRIAETTNDTHTMGFLQELFKDTFDGFISPRIFSPFHIEKSDSTMSPEIIIFNPKASRIEELKKYPSTIHQIRIVDLLRSNHGYILIDNKKNTKYTDMRLDFFMYGGVRPRVGSHYLDTAETLLNMNDNVLTEVYNDGKKLGSKWSKKIDLRIVYTPSPSFSVNKFPIEMGI